MPLNLPKLDEGRVYCRAEVKEYLGKQDGTSDFDVVALHFPRGLQSWQHDGRGWRDGEEMVLQYQVFSLAEFKQKILELDETFASDESHRRRVDAIVECLLSGKPVYPVFLQQNDPQRRIIEGMHRAVALWRIESHCLPAFLTGYRNWFDPDTTLDGFEREDEIVGASLRDVCGFFMHATSVDHKGIDLALFGGDRLRRCDEAFVARYHGKAIGAVTITVAKGQPTVSTLYVLKQFRRRGVAYRLFERALLRFKEATISGVFCDVQSQGMAATLERLAHRRPELRALVNERIGYSSGEDLETAVDDE